MRPLLLIAPPLVLLAQPATAQESQIAPVVGDIQEKLRDPALGKRMQAVSQSLVDVLMDLKVGKVAAALDGRQPSTAEANQTVRDLVRRDHPGAESDLRRKVAEAGPALERGMAAMAEALPQISESAQRAAEALRRIENNLPSSDYPKR